MRVNHYRKLTPEETTNLIQTASKYTEWVEVKRIAEDNYKDPAIVILEYETEYNDEYDETRVQRAIVTDKNGQVLVPTSRGHEDELWGSTLGKVGTRVFNLNQPLAFPDLYMLEEKEV